MLSESAATLGVRVQLVDEIERERTTDLVVLEQLGLVATHRSVSRACRFAQTVSADTRPMTPASTMSTQTVIRRQRASRGGAAVLIC